ncbi:MAG: TetR/AcrR family transcriptional regulator C-terminal domain-containing protein [Clostridiales bacterium]|nr:TetR/AcrR family transcriptional regulator C-terminal domain-containing protein [Clostridiales bacterium]
MKKITVAQICEKYGMSRKSFYYHFKDKYDLVAWIFDTECVAIIKEHSFTSEQFFSTFCGYLYENRSFYRKVLKIQGQNSFSEHLEEFIYPLIQNRLKVMFGQDKVPSICVDLLTDGFVGSIKRWLLNKDCLPPEEFVSILETLTEKIALSYSQDEI